MEEVELLEQFRQKAGARARSVVADRRDAREADAHGDDCRLATDARSGAGNRAYPDLRATSSRSYACASTGQTPMLSRSSTMPPPSGMVFKKSA